MQKRVPTDSRLSLISLLQWKNEMIYNYLQTGGYVFVCISLLFSRMTGTTWPMFLKLCGGVGQGRSHYILMWIQVFVFFIWVKQSGFVRGLIFTSECNLVQIQIKIWIYWISMWFDKRAVGPRWRDVLSYLVFLVYYLVCFFLTNRGHDWLIESDIFKCLFLSEQLNKM